jgi:SAM-dependent methyltransferase
MNNLTQNYQKIDRITRPPTMLRLVYYNLLGFLLSTPYYLAAKQLNTPGLKLHKNASNLARKLLFKSRDLKSTKELWRASLYPMDLTRYFEFEFVCQSIGSNPTGRWLDVSSPRMLPLIFLDQYPNLNIDLLNPDTSDLEITRNWLKLTGWNNRAQTYGCLVEEAPFYENTFDIITSVSVIEHIPQDADAIEGIWRLLKPGGKLIITLPCAAQASEEYVDIDFYKLLNEDKKGFIFLEYIYNEQTLKERFYPIMGRPSRMVVYGENYQGELRENLVHRWSGKLYPHWQEPYYMGKNYKYFDQIDLCPGEGVVGLEFIKK